MVYRHLVALYNNMCQLCLFFKSTHYHTLFCYNSSILYFIVKYCSITNHELKWRINAIIYLFV
jgi:hypothetical protein